MSSRGRGAPPRGPRGAYGADTRSRGYGRARDSSPGVFTPRGGRHHSNGSSSFKDGPVDLAIRGWKNSKAADNVDGGISSLKKFLERKASTQPDRPAKITEKGPEGDAYIISVQPELVDRLLRLNGFTFAGAPLVVQRWTSDSTDEMVTSPLERGTAGQSYSGHHGFGKNSPSAPSQSGVDTKAFLKQVLGKRYDPQLRLLNLSALKADAELQRLGVFANPATESKFFPVIMKICDEIWDTPGKKAEAVESVIVSNNQLGSVLDITTLAATFPSLKNIDLSNNLLADFEGLKFWRWKFRDLEHLIITNNAIISSPDFQSTILKWYPKLLQLNGVHVRTPEDVQKQQQPIPTLPPYFQDEADICAKFVTDFFPLFDTDRTTALRNFYDASSNFSVSINTHAKRVRGEESRSLNWDQYIKKSRNLLKITHLPARVSRLFRGSDIQAVWEQLPRTKHPSLNQHPSEWLVECHSLPGLPDPQSQSSSGVGGLIVMVHGNFEEIHSQSGKTTDRRSFDRTFIIGPGGGLGGIRVVSDLLVLRAQGGSDAWNLNLNLIKNNANCTSNNTNNTNNSSPSISTLFNNASLPNLQAPATATTAITPTINLPSNTITTTTPPQQAQQAQHPEIPAGSTIGQPSPGKPEIQLQQEIRAIDLSFRTGMRLEWAAKCLMENSWDVDKAFVNFRALVAGGGGGQIPREAFLDGVGQR